MSKSICCFLLLAFLISPSMGQDIKYAVSRTSPFDYYEFEGEKKVFIKLENERHQLLMIDSLDMADVLKSFISKEGSIWKKRIREDLVDGLQYMGHKAHDPGTFSLMDSDGNTKVLDIDYTREKRQKAKKQTDDELVRSYIHVVARDQLIEDLASFQSHVASASSYQGLNGYDALTAIEELKSSIKEDSFKTKSLRIELAKILGQIGDRHSYVREVLPSNKKYLPFSAAPLDGKVLTLIPTKDGFEPFNKNYPYLKALNGIPINSLLEKIDIDDIAAPKEARFARAIIQLKYLEENFEILNRELPDQLEYTFSDGDGNDKSMIIKHELDGRKYHRWFDKSSQEFFAKINEEVAYIGMPQMTNPNTSPEYFEQFNDFMINNLNSKSIVVDIRNNGGGTRDLIMELGKYLVHPDSIYVVNVARQKTAALTEDEESSLNGRFLYSYADHDADEKKVIDLFMEGFKPMYNLSEDQYAQHFYTILNGRKIGTIDHHFKGHLFILMNERSFSAASVFASVFKGLPNVTLAGVQTDGSSGNSRTFELPNSKLLYKISTMVSFQKDGTVLDGYGTVPDLYLPRDMDQLLWKRDSQLETLLEHINKSN